MKAKRSRPAKGGTSKKKVPSDVSPSTGLPPLVEGQLRCFLRVTVSRVLWTVHKPPPVTLVRLRWWGESSSGTYFCPRDGAQISQKAVKTTARFPIRCGPKQFTSYLTDMGSLVLEVQTKPDHLPIARAEVAGISRLSLSHSINGFYTLVSPTSEKLGELQVSLALEALTEAYDSSSSVPTTDISIEAPPLTTLMPPTSRQAPVNSERESAGGSNGNTPRGRDNVYFQTLQTDKQKEGSTENRLPATDGSQERRAVMSSSGQRTYHGQRSNDILSVILERGSKLRNAMAVSAMKCDVDDLALKDTPLLLPKDNIPAFSRSCPPSRGTFLQNILHAEPDSGILHSPHAATLSTNLNPDSFADTENRAVDLLLGSLDTSPILILDGNSSLPASLSGHSSVCGDSELNDPQYDQSLLENLFYKNPMLDVETGGNGMESEKNASQKQITTKEIEVQESGWGHPSEDGDALSRLGTDQLTVLGGIRLARVTIHSLTAPTDSTATTTSIRDKPPRPVVNKKCSYFVEYMLPVPSTSSRHDHGQAGEVTRVVSSKVTGGVVKFQQSCVFPVRLSGTTIEQWWGTDLIFKIYSRRIDQKKPVPVGKAVHPLRSVLLSKELSQTVVLAVESLEGTNVSQDIGPLKVSLELAADNRDFSSAKIRLTERARSPSRAVSDPQREPSPMPQRVERPPNSPPVSRVDMRTVQEDIGHTSLTQSYQHSEEAPVVLLHALLMVPDGKNFNSGSLQGPNFYLNCKLLGSDETARSAISWGQTNPCFNFVQVTPVALTPKLLERMRNNVVVIEVWHRTGGSGDDRLTGLVKLPLHQFYMSFRDAKITDLLLQAQYPVLGVDCYMPVMDVFSGGCKGTLRVLLAMGKSEQIVALQRMRDEEFGSASHHTRPVHLLDHQPYSKTKESTPPQLAMREHLFVLRVQKVQGLTPLQSTVWGEADCYIQYSFPSQEGDALQNMDPNLIESSVNLQQFRSTTTLCVPDPVFEHSDSHVLLAPAGVPVQRLLLSSLSSQGLTNGGGIQFEVWCRYYYPNVRDQLVAKGMLPLSKLCAMVTMQKQQPDEAQVFSVPLVPKIDSPSGRQPQPSGLLDVCIQYKQRPARPEGGQRVGGVASRMVTLVVQIHRVSGLQAAARALSERDENLRYYADVGVNAYVTVQLSFLPGGEKRSTRVAARTFCPELDYHTEFPCEIQLQRSSGETCSLAELLQEASAIFNVWNRDSRKVAGSLKSEDALLGTVKIPLADLVYKRTGISGWFGVYIPQVLGSSHGHHIMVGGLEISINFAHHSDRERVNRVSQLLGWETDRRELDQQDGGDDNEEEQAWESPNRTMSLSIWMPRAWLPVQCLLLPGHSQLQRSTYCYFRYKLYDQEAFCSHMKHPSLEDGGEQPGLATVGFQGSRTVELRGGQPLLWYLREEKLEVQLWVAFRKERTCRPHDTDRLAGSAFVDLSSLAKRPGNKLTISGVYPLFSRSASDLCGAAIRVHITSTTEGSLPEERSTENDNQGELSSSGEEDHIVEGLSAAAASGPSCSQERQQSESFTGEDPVAAPQCTDPEESFAVTITVDRAMHLSLKGCPLAERGAGLPCCFVSYSTNDSDVPVSTSVVANTDCPVWDHHQECRLSKQLLVDPQQALVFKVWHKGEMERVIGFASVDLSPLLSGFQSVCGWYNITDFSGQCQGQVKVSIMPLTGVQTFRGQRRAMSEEDSKNSSALFRAHPLSYHTTATYNSFPSHISLYPEQKIHSPEHIDGLFCERASESDRHGEHMDNVRLHHQSLQEQPEAHHSGSGTTDIRPSSSVLFSALRKNLSELDDIQRYFSRKLSTPTFPPPSEQQQVCRSRHEEHQDNDSHSHQLLLKSTQLVGEVNNIISGLPGPCLKTMSSNSHSGSQTPPIPVPTNSHDLLSEIVDRQRGVAESPLEAVSPVPSVLPRSSEDNMDSDEEGELADRRMEEDHEDEDELNGEGDYEETLMEQRPVNEVTSLTDKTSPWTSVLSDPDSQGNPGELEEQPSSHHHHHHPDLTLDGIGRNGSFSPQNDTLCPHTPNTVAHSCASPSERFDSSLGSTTGDVSDTERDGQVTPVRLSDPQGNPGELECQASPYCQDLTQGDDGAERGVQETPPAQATGEEEEGPEPGGMMSDANGAGSPRLENEPPRSPPDPPQASGENQSCTPYAADAQPQLSAHVEIPNFFLPSHHLEASMRALRLAPAFARASTSQESAFVRHAIPYRRAPRPRPAASMTREETERIAKIFSAHFNEES